MGDHLRRPGGRGVTRVPTAINGSNSEVLTPFCWPESNILPAQKGLRMRSLALSETPCTWRRPLYGNWEISSVSGEARRTGS